MNTKLKPIAGALIVGLIGMAHAACYHEQSYVCQVHDQPTDEYIYFNCGGSYVTATSDWIGWDVTQCYDPDTDQDCRASSQNTEYCHGPGKYHNCVTGHDETIDPAYSSSGGSWQRVDYNTTCSP